MRPHDRARRKLRRQRLREKVAAAGDLAAMVDTLNATVRGLVVQKAAADAKVAELERKVVAAVTAFEKARELQDASARSAAEALDRFGKLKSELSTERDERAALQKRVAVFEADEHDVAKLRRRLQECKDLLEQTRAERDRALAQIPPKPFVVGLRP